MTAVETLEVGPDPRAFVAVTLTLIWSPYEKL